MGRLRRLKNDIELVSSSNYYFNKAFNINQPLSLEIGMGKGGFIIKHALTHNQINYLGVDCYPTVILKAIKKLNKLNEPLNNLMFLSINIKDIFNYLQPHSVSKIYLNFSDPWPKKRHEKRRLTSPSFLSLYEQLLIKGGEIEMKTDNDALYQYSLEQINLNPNFIIISNTNNLYKRLKGDIIQSEYEKKFIAKNKTINFIHFKLK